MDLLSFYPLEGSKPVQYFIKPLNILEVNYKKTIWGMNQRSWFGSHILLLILGCLLLTTKKAQATHFAGGELTYTCLGNNQYKVQLVLHRTCAGVGMTLAENISISSASCGLTLPAVTLTRDTFYEIKAPQFCIYNVTDCSGGNLPGYELHFYCGIITLPQTCTDWIIGWSSCCRNNAITTLSTSGSVYVEAMINNTVCNSSPKFTASPIVFLEDGECYNYNYGVLDPDQDTLRYALTCPLSASNTCIPFIAGLGVNQPIFTNPGSFNIDQNTGQLSFCTTPNLAQFGVMKMTVYNIKNGDTVGYVQRDAMVIVLNNQGTNTPPSNVAPPNLISGGTWNAASQTFQVCAGQTLAFETIIYDPDGDSLKVDPYNTNFDEVFGVGNWNLILNNTAPYQVDSVQVIIQVMPTSDQIGIIQAILSFTDNLCPIAGVQMHGYQFNVLGIRGFIDSIETTFSADCSDNKIRTIDTYCPGLVHDIPLNSIVSGTGVGTYNWVQLAGPTVSFSNASIANPIVTTPATTQIGDSIVLEVTYTGSTCTTSDRVVIYFQMLPIGLFVNASEVILCPNGIDTIDFSATTGATNVTGIYTWTASPASAISNLNNQNIHNPTGIFQGNSNDSIIYTVAYSHGLCSETADVLLQWRPGIAMATASMDTICAGDTIQLMGVLSDTLIWRDTVNCYLYQVDSIAFSPVSGTGTVVSLADDAVSTALPIGFDFEFYCNNYNHFQISSNGFIILDSISTNANNGCCAGQNIPDAMAANNLIALCWADLNPPNGGTISYFTTGTIPNRQLVVNFTNVPRFGGSTVTVQMVLHEGTNFIDIHTTSISADGLTTQGIENIDGSLGLAVPGRNSSVWSSTNEAYRFIPGNSNVTGNIVYNWTPSVSLSNATINTPDAFPLTTTTYQLTINEQGCISTDSIEIVVDSNLDLPTISCGLATVPTSSVLFEWGQVIGATGWEYSLDYGMTWTTALLQDSSFLLTSLLQGTCYDIWVRAIGGIGTCAMNSVATFNCCTNVLSPVVNQNGVTLTAFASGPNITYQWVDCNNGYAAIGGAIGRSFTPPANGDYAVIIGDGINSAISSCVNVNTLGMNQLMEELGIVCSPNPTTGLLQIKKDNVDEVIIEVMDNMGRILLTTSITTTIATIDLSEYPTGIYFIAMRNAQKRVVQKVIKE